MNIYSDYLLHQPAILFGRNSVSGLSVYPCARVAVLCGNSLRDEDKELFRKTFKKRSLHFIQRSWRGEPDLESLGKSISELENIKPDAIIAVGGGSVIDGVKLCRLYYEFPYFKVNETKLSQLEFKTRFIAVPTTVGSGTEVSSSAVFINRKYGRKEMIMSHDLQPSVVVLDPGYVEHAPERIIVASMIDAIGHITEGYVSIRKNKLTDIYAEKGLEILIREFSKNDPEKRDYQEIQLAGYFGGLVQNHCIVGAAHAIAHQLAMYGFSHGEAVALLLPGVIRLNCHSNLEINKRYKQMCEAANIEEISELTYFIESQACKAGIMERKKELRETISRLKADRNFVDDVINDKAGRGNPIPITEGYITELVEVFL